MSLLQDEIKEIQEIRSMYRNNKLSSGDINTLIKTYQQTEKRASTILRAIITDAKYGNNIKKNLIKEGLLEK